MPAEHRDYRWRFLLIPPELWVGSANFHPPLIHQTAIVEAFATIDSGLVRSTTIGERVYVMKHAHVGHDALIGDGCNLAPGCVIGGHVELGAGVKVGINAAIRPRVKVGAGAVIGMGAVVVRDVPAGEVWAGVPAHRLDIRRQAPDDWPEYDGWLEWFESWHRERES